MNRFIRLFLIFTTILSVNAVAAEKILISNAQGPQQSMTPQFLRIIERANANQNLYQFVVEFKQGGYESIAVKHMLEDPRNRLATITNSVVEGIDRGFVQEQDITPVFSFGDSCWTVITSIGKDGQGLASIANDPRVREITGGGPAPGGAAHLTALEVATKYKLPVRYILYKSNIEALVNMVGDENSVNFVVERAQNYTQFREKSSRVNALAVSCPTRHPRIPNVKTLAEQGIDAPYIWNFLVASSKMPVDKRRAIEDIITRATRDIGAETLFELSDIQSPIFRGVTTEDHYNQSLTKLKKARKKWETQIKSN